MLKNFNMKNKITTADTIGNEDPSAAEALTRPCTNTPNLRWDTNHYIYTRIHSRDASNRPVSRWAWRPALGNYLDSLRWAGKVLPFREEKKLSFRKWAPKSGYHFLFRAYTQLLYAEKTEDFFSVHSLSVTKAQPFSFMLASGAQKSHGR